MTQVEVERPVPFHGVSIFPAGSYPAARSTQPVVEFACLRKVGSQGEPKRACRALYQHVGFLFFSRRSFSAFFSRIAYVVFIEGTRPYAQDRVDGRCRFKSSLHFQYSSTQRCQCRRHLFRQVGEDFLRVCLGVMFHQFSVCV